MIQGFNNFLYSFFLPTKFVRVYVSKGSGDKGRGVWIVRKSEIIGKTPEEIKDMLSLPQTPTHVSDVKIPEGVKMRRGEAAQNKFGNGGAEQFEIFDNKVPEEWFSNPRKIGDTFND